jgi:hypothetical protein
MPTESHARRRALTRAADEAGVTQSARHRVVRLFRRGEPRKALQLLREQAAREPSGRNYCWLADGLLRIGKHEEALGALRQALYCFRHERTSGRACSVARWMLRLDPSDLSARKIAAREHSKAA